MIWVFFAYIIICAIGFAGIVHLTLKFLECMDDTFGDMGMFFWAIGGTVISLSAGVPMCAGVYRLFKYYGYG